jgi:hypothetical protein
MPIGDSPQLVASRLSGEIRAAESRLDRRIHELETSLIRSGGRRRRDLSDVLLMVGPSVLIFVILLTAHVGSSRDSTRSEQAPPAAHAEAPAPHSDEPR